MDRPSLRVKIKLPVGLASRSASAGVSSAKRKLQQLLTGYPDPSAGVGVLASALSLHGDTKLFTTAFPTWTELLASVEHKEQPSKRPHVTVTSRGGVAVENGLVEGSCPSLVAEVAARNGDCSSKPVPTTDIQASHRQGLRIAFDTQLAFKTSPVQELSPVENQPFQAKHSKEAPCSSKDLVAAVVSSASDQATTFALYSQNPSPTEVTANLPSARLTDTQPTTAQEKPQSTSHDREQQHQHPSQPPSVPKSKPIPTLPSNRHSIAVQTQETISLLPAELLSVHSAPGLNVPAPRQVALSQMMLPPHQCFLPVPASAMGICKASDTAAIDAEFKRLLDAAQERKRQSDKMRGNRPFNAKALCMYVESALLFMRAVECCTQAGSPADKAARAGSLCIQTCEFLCFTARTAETSSCPELSNVVRDCVRAVCERLAAACLAKDNVLSSGRVYKDYADRLDRIMAKTGPLHAGMAAGARKHGDPSPDDSHASSNDMRIGNGQGGLRSAAGVGAVNATNELGPLQAKVVTAARQMVRFADLMRRAVLTFQALMERDEVRDSAAAARACMHLSALIMGGGCVDGVRVIAYAYQALECFKTL